MIIFDIFLFYWVGLGPIHFGLDRTRSDHEQWRHSLLTVHVNSGESFYAEEGGYPARQF